jgi:MFS family permease
VHDTSKPLFAMEYGALSDGDASIMSSECSAPGLIPAATPSPPATTATTGSGTSPTTAAAAAAAAAAVPTYHDGSIVSGDMSVENIHDKNAHTHTSEEPHQHGHTAVQGSVIADAWQYYSSRWACCFSHSRSHSRNSGSDADEDLSFRSHLRDVVVMALCFSLVEAALLVVLSLATAVNKGLGEASSGALYIGFSITGLVSPTVVKYLGGKWGIIVGLSGYCIYIACNVYPTWLTLMPSATLAGVFGSFLWTSVGCYLTEKARLYADGSRVFQLSDVLGTFNGLFVGIFFFLIVTCQSGSSLMLSGGEFGSSKEASSSAKFLTFAFFASVSVVSAIALIFAIPELPSDVRRKERRRLGIHGPNAASGVQDVDPHSETTDLHYQRVNLSSSDSISVSSNGKTPTADADADADALLNRNLLGIEESAAESARLARKAELWRDLTSSVRFIAEPKLALMIASNMAFGFVQGFQNGTYARKIVSPSIGVSNIGNAASISALSGALVSLPFGYLSDRFGRWTIMILGFLAHGGVSVYFATWPDVSDDSVPTDADLHGWSTIIFTSMALGIGNSVWNSMNAAVFGEFFAIDREAAFANLKMWSGGATAIAYFLFPHISLHVQTAILISFLCVGIVGYALANWLHEREKATTRLEGLQRELDADS